MVSFQCEACGDVLTKKKLDPHRGRCHGAYYSCIDCMVTFQGTQYRSHTSCMTEAQKYQGALYREKPTKNQKRKSVTIAENAITHKPREAYVEDAPDVDSVPPPAPSPPPTKPALPEPKSDAKAVNVFNFQDPSTPETPANGSNEQMKMLSDAPSIFDKSTQLVQYKDKDNAAFEEDGFCYGSGPIPSEPPYNKASNVSTEFVTPASKRDRRRRDREQPPPSLEHSASSLIGKRKRGQPEEASNEDDVSMVDAPAATPQLTHSGLTGGLSQMMRMQSPDYRSDEEGRTHPVSPVKRTRRNKDKENGHPESGLGISMGQKLISLIGGATGVTGVNGSSNDPTKALRSRRHSSSSDGDKARKSTKKKSKDKEKKDKKQKSTSTALVPVKEDSSDSDTPPRRLKAIEYKRRGDADDRSRSPRSSKHRKDRERDRDSKEKDKDKQMVLYKDKDGSDAESETGARREKAAAFLSFVTKGPESERGYSVHKALKKFHREVVVGSPAGSEDGKEKKGRGRSRHRERDRGEEDELWRMLRLKRNDRGEIVVFI